VLLSVGQGGKTNNHAFKALTASLVLLPYACVFSIPCESLNAQGSSAKGQLMTVAIRALPMCWAWWSQVALLASP